MAYDSDFKSHLSYSKMEKAFREAKKNNKTKKDKKYKKDKKDNES